MQNFLLFFQELKTTVDKYLLSNLSGSMVHKRTRRYWMWQLRDHRNRQRTKYIPFSKLITLTRVAIFHIQLERFLKRTEYTILLVSWFYRKTLFLVCNLGWCSHMVLLIGSWKSCFSRSDSTIFFFLISSLMPLRTPFKFRSAQSFRIKRFKVTAKCFWNRGHINVMIIILNIFSDMFI